MALERVREHWVTGRGVPNKRHCKWKCRHGRTQSFNFAWNRLCRLLSRNIVSHDFFPKSLQVKNMSVLRVPEWWVPPSPALVFPQPVMPYTFTLWPSRKGGKCTLFRRVQGSNPGSHACKASTLVIELPSQPWSYFFTLIAMLAIFIE